MNTKSSFITITGKPNVGKSSLLTKISKRDVGAALGAYPEEGFLPKGVMNFLALLGWSPKDDTEIFSPQAVSYTHLDGYKRQGGKGPGSSFPPPGSEPRFHSPADGAPSDGRE